MTIENPIRLKLDLQDAALTLQGGGHPVLAQAVLQAINLIDVLSGEAAARQALPLSAGGGADADLLEGIRAWQTRRGDYANVTLARSIAEHVNAKIATVDLATMALDGIRMRKALEYYAGRRMDNGHARAALAEATETGSGTDK